MIAAIPAEDRPTIAYQEAQPVGEVVDEYIGLGIRTGYAKWHVKAPAAGTLLYTMPPEDETEKLISLLKECSATLKMWADVAPAVGLIKDIDAVLAARGGT